MLGLTLLYVGAVLFINGLWLMNRISGKEVPVINFLVGILSFLIAADLVFKHEDNLRILSAGAFTFLFAFTYIWIGVNQIMQNDSKGLGWFCLFVSLTTITIAINSTFHVTFEFSSWSIFNWYAWSLLWFLNFLMLTLDKKIEKFVGIYTIFCAFITGWLPGILILQELQDIY